MQIAFFINDLEREHAGYTTTVLAHQAAMRGHQVCYVTPSDFALRADDSLWVHARRMPKRNRANASKSALDRGSDTPGLRGVVIVQIPS